VSIRQNGGASGSFADFDLAYDHINSYEQGSRGGVYSVQAGDTLQGIAAALWGDASLWYKLAEINGLSAESALIEGLPLIIPVGQRSHKVVWWMARPMRPPMMVPLMRIY
jgi:nucleoid-associated protein YgaU